MKTKITRFINNISIHKKMCIGIFFVNMLFTGTASYMAISYITEVDKKMLYDQIAQNLSYSGKYITAVLTTIERLSNIIVADDDIQRKAPLLQKSASGNNDTPYYTSLYKTVVHYYFELHQYYVSTVTLFIGDYTISSNFRDKEMAKDTKDYLLHTASAAKGRPVWCGGEQKQDNSTIFMVREIRLISFLDLSSVGTVVIRIDMDKLIQSISSKPRSNIMQAQNNMPIFLFFNEERLFYSSPNIEMLRIDLVQKRLANKDYAVIKDNKTSFFAAKSEIPEYRWAYICLISYERTAKAIFRSRMIQSFIISAGFIVTLIAVYVLTHSITMHIHSLIAKINAFRGDSTVLPTRKYDYSTRRDEIGILHRQFDRMAREITDLIDKDYKNSLLMKEAQMAALENQINPHFLYNALESVNWRAKAIGAERISQTVESLGKLLRMTLSDKSTAHTLKMELELVNYYITIQKLRFEDRLAISFEYSGALEQCIVPKFSIQPLVENAIHHALEESLDVCTIVIQAQKNCNDVIVSVSNSGSFFDDDILLKLQSGFTRGRRNGIGLVNIEKRIKLTFGAKYGLSFYNKDDMAVVEMRLPFTLAEC